MIEDPSDRLGLKEERKRGNDHPSSTRWQSHDLGNPTDTKDLEEEGGRGGEGGEEGKRHTSDGALKNWCSRVGSTPDIQRRRRRDGAGEERGNAGKKSRRMSVVKHDDWRSAAPFFEVVAAKLQGPSPGPETLAWPSNYHYGGSPFRARCLLPGTKLLGRGPARRAPFTYVLLASLFSRPPPCIYPPVLPRPVDRPTKYLLLPLLVPFDPAFINIFVRTLSRKWLRSHTA